MVLVYNGFPFIYFFHSNITKHFGRGAEKIRDFITQPNYISHRQASNDGAGDKASQEW